MKKISFIFLLALLSLAASAEVVKVGGLWYNLIYHPQGDYTTAEVVASQDDPYSGWQTIPEKIYYGEDCAVTSIGESAFEGCDGITYLAIPSSITHIGKYAFRDCGSNMEVQIVNLAAWCKVEFGNEHSSPLSSAKKFYLKDSGAYAYKHEVKSLYIPNGVESISNFAFYQCRSITSLIIPGSVKSIGSSAFEDCTGLTSIYLSEGVKSIGGSSFEGCTGITSLVLPSSLTSIAINAFKNCSSINTIVSRIQSPFAFIENVFSTYSTATVIVPEGTTTAYQSTSGWNLFENITDDSSQAPAKRTIHVTTAGTLPNLVSGDEFYIEELILTGELNGTDVRFLRAMSGIDYLIRENRQDSSEPYYVASVATPGNLKVLNITGTKIVEGGERYYIPSEYYSDNLSQGRYGYYTVSNTISDYMFNGCKLTSINLPNSVESIGYNAFCSSMTSISIPVSVTSINYYAFRQCTGLTSITIPNSVTSIGWDAFSDCSGLTSITIPNSVTTIGSYAFQNCSGLTTIVSEIETPFEIGENVFYSYYNDIYATATLYVPVGKKTTYEATEGWNKFANIKEYLDGDVNLDEKVNRNDQNALVAHIMGEMPEGFYEGLADLNGDNDVNAADLVKLVDILNNGGLSTDSQFDFDNVNGNLVVASLTCTLNNKRNEAIQLKKCELYCKGNLVSYKNFTDSYVTASGSKECSFNNLARHAASTTDFTVCWHYTVNGESFVYRCPLTD